MTATPTAEGSGVLPPLPAPDVDSEPFWAAARDGRLVLCRCEGCRQWLQPPLERCLRCGAATSFEPATGDGRIYSFIVVRHPSVPAFATQLPYVVALVEMSEGVRLPGRLVGVEPADVAVGQPVRLGFERWPDAPEPALIWHPIVEADLRLPDARGVVGPMRPAMAVAASISSPAGMPPGR